MGAREEGGDPRHDGGGQGANAAFTGFERAARMHLLAAAAGDIQPIDAQLAREAHDWVLRPKRNAIAFDYYARRSLRHGRHADCLSAAHRSV